MCGSQSCASVKFPTLFHSRYTGIIVTWPGSIIVASRTANRKFRSGKRKYANEKATIALESVTASAARPLIQKLLKNQCATGATFRRYCVAGTGRSGPVKFQAQCSGISLLSKVSPLGLNDALTSQRNG